jgi:hypothetical protein
MRAGDFKDRKMEQQINFRLPPRKPEEQSKQGGRDGLSRKPGRREESQSLLRSPQDILTEVEINIVNNSE